MLGICLLPSARRLLQAADLAHKRWAAGEGLRGGMGAGAAAEVVVVGMTEADVELRVVRKRALLERYASVSVHLREVKRAAAAVGGVGSGGGGDDAEPGPGKLGGGYGEDAGRMRAYVAGQCDAALELVQGELRRQPADVFCLRAAGMLYSSKHALLLRAAAEGHPAALALQHLVRAHELSHGRSEATAMAVVEAVHEAADRYATDVSLAPSDTPHAFIARV